MSTPPAARSYRWLFWLLAIAGFAADQVSKYELFAHLYNEGRGGEIVVIPGVFNLHVAPFRSDEGSGIRRQLRSFRGCEMRPHVNEGALFGIGQGWNIIFGVVSVIAAAFIIGWSLRATAGQDRFLCVALGLILAGTTGNLYDRIVFDGVRDFLHWYKWLDWPVFNVADVCLVFGAGMLLLEAFFRTPESERAEPAAE